MTEHFDPRALKSSAAASIPSTARLQDTVRQDRLSPYPPSSNERTDNAPMQQADGVRLPKRLRANTHATTQAPPPPDPLDADPFALMASQSHLLEGNQLLQMQRGNSSNVTDMERLPTPNIADLEMQVGLPEAAGSSGKVEDIVDTPLPKKDKPANDASATEQQLQQLKSQFDAAKAQHRLQLQERNRQIGRLQEDREKLKGLLKQAEGDVRNAKASGLCTVCQQNTRNCLILPCLHYLLCAGCVQQHTSTCPFCPACQTKVSGLLVVLTTI